LRRAAAIATAFLLTSPAQQLFAFLSDAGAYPAPNYYTFRPPARGGSYSDPVFGTSIKRISDAPNTLDNAGGGMLNFITNEYSTMTPFNKDNTRLILVHQSYYAVYDGSGNYLRDLPFAVHASSQPRWSRSNAKLLYFINGNTLYTVDVDSLVVSVVRAFGEYGSISGHGESDICFDGNHLVLVGDSRDVFVYEISTNTKGTPFNIGGRAFDSVYITPSHNVTITWLQAGTTRYTGIELFNQNMAFQRQVTHAGGHMDVTKDTNGSEVLVWANAGDPWPIANCENGIVKVRLSDGQQTCLLELADWGLATHVSATDQSGWFFMETYAYNDPPPNQWSPYTNELLQVAMDGSEVRRLLHHRSRPFNGYYYQPRASVSRDGSKLVFSSNYGLQAQDGLPSDYGDVYLVSVPGGPNPGPSPSPSPSPTPTPGPSPTPTPGPSPTPGPGWRRVEQNEPGVTLSGTWPLNNQQAHSARSAVLDMSANSTATFTFTGTGVRWLGQRDQWAGKAKVYLDGVLKATVDLYADTTLPQSVLWSKTGLANKSHTLKVVVLGTKRAKSQGKWVWTDAFDWK
jgi:hypothetical protein